MPDTNPQHTLDTNASELRLNRFEAVWLAWRPGEPMPRWQDHLPEDAGSCNPELIFSLLQLDIECRVKAGLSALLAEHYFEHPRLQREDARLDAERQVELIRWEYQQRWNQSDPAQRIDYEAAFPQHADALRDLKPSSRCRRCQRMIVLEETFQTIRCPNCGSDALLDGHVPPFVAAMDQETEAPPRLDSREYQLVEQLGKGGMGEVYRACDPALGRDLAIKVVKSDYRGDAEAERRFLREARVTGSLQHPGIVPVHNLGRLADGRLHYTMRLVRGQTFAAILKDEAGKAERLPYLLSIFEKTCQAVAYAHSKRVIHRDLKPANVMVGKFGEVQVMDWGLAKLLTPEDEAADEGPRLEAGGTLIHTEATDTPSDLTRAGSGLGTPAYMSPEQALGELDAVDERTDVFALGAILCEMLTGQPPYSGRDGNEVLRRARRGDLTEALARLEQGSADTALTALCRKCLAPDYTQRPRDAGVIAQCVADHQAEVQERLRRTELERVAAETRAKEEQVRAAVEAERAREALARAKAERRAKRRMLALLLAMGVILGLSIFTSWWIVRERDARAKEQIARQVADAQEREAGSYWRRGRDLYEKGLLNEAIDEFREAVRIKPDYAPGYNFLGTVLADKGQVDEAIACYKRSIESNPNFSLPHNNLGLALRKKGDLEGAIVCYKRAIELDRKYAFAHDHLGDALYDKGSVDEAIAEYREAIRLEPYEAAYHTDLGGWLKKEGRVDEAITEYREAIRLEPDEARYHNDLGIALKEKGRNDEAITEYREATHLEPKEAVYRSNLGFRLRAKGQLDEAIAEYRKAIQVKPHYAEAHYGLALALSDKGQLDEAIACYREALLLKPDHAYAHSGIGKVLLQQGQYAAARNSFQRAVELFPKNDSNRQVYIQYLQDCDRFPGLEKKLPASLNGQELPANAEEAIALATMCRFQQRRCAAARLYADAFDMEPGPAADPKQQHRYNAAYCAALAAAGQSEDARLLSDKVVAMFRRWALHWLRDDLAAYSKDAECNNPAANKTIQQRLAHWRGDSDLASVREPEALDRLPDNERAAWQALWRDVDELAKRTANKNAAKK